MTSSPEAELVFSARRSALERCLRWRLTEDTLFCEQEAAPAPLLSWFRGSSLEQWPQSLPLREIASIRARFDPTRFDPNRYRCDLVSDNGARISIFSSHYVGPGQFDNRGDDYTAFVEKLVLRTQRHRPSLNLRAGLPWPSYLLQHGLILVSLFALVTMLGVAGFPVFGHIWVKFGIVIIYGVLALRYAWINVPTTIALPMQNESGRDSAE